jgi:hypothetical protein
MSEQVGGVDTKKKTDQVIAFPGNYVPPAMTVNQEGKGFTDKEKAILRGLLLDLIFAEPRTKSHAE